VNVVYFHVILDNSNVVLYSFNDMYMSNWNCRSLPPKKRLQRKSNKLPTVLGTQLCKNLRL
jgi:hypothetical protein